MSDHLSTVGGGKPLPMSVRNVGFLLDRLGSDCAPLQYLRELTQNGLEAIARAGSKGQIVWDLDWLQFDLHDPPLKKLCVIDSGDGMTGEEMLKFINQLSSSGSVQSMSANYGIGAKIAAATKNPAGVIYQSWKGGEGYMIHLRKDPDTGEYGLVQFQLEDGTFSHFMPLDPTIKPEEIENHGTKVILYGRTVEDNTMLPPGEVSAPSRWIAKYLNTRYFIFPEGVTVKAREGWDNPRSDKDRNLLRTITGQKPYLEKHSSHSGSLDITGATVHWWILREEPAISNNSGFIESAGHVAALYQDELYDRFTARSGTAQLQLFGVLFGSKFVVLYVEPHASDIVTLTTNTARTNLLLNYESLPWAEWAQEFRENMPTELAKFIKDKAAANTERDHLKSIKERLKAIMDLYKVSRYRPAPAGIYQSDDTSRLPSGVSLGSGRRAKSSAGGSQGRILGTSSTGSRDGDVGNIYHLFQKKGGTPSDETQSDPFPRVDWVSVRDGTRSEDDMEDRAAKYLPEQNTLLCNADFRVFRDMAQRLAKEKEYSSGVTVDSVVEDVVHAWFEQALVETVLGIQQLKGSKEWSSDAIQKALSEEALTAAVMQRYHIHIACRRELGAKLGRTSGSS